MSDGIQRYKGTCLVDGEQLHGSFMLPAEVELTIGAKDARIASLSDALVKIIEMNLDHAADQYGDSAKAESWSCVRVAREALAGQLRADIGVESGYMQGVIPAAELDILENSLGMPIERAPFSNQFALWLINSVRMLTAAQPSPEPVAASPSKGGQMIDTSAWEACNPGCDPELNGEKSRHCMCEPAKVAMAAQVAAASHSEDGRKVPETGESWSAALLEVAVVLEAVSGRDSAERLANMDAGKTLGRAFERLKSLRAQHSRIVAAKDAEIARLEKLAYIGEHQFEDCTYKFRLEELRAQPARQVGDERCQTCDGTGDVHGFDGEWRGRCHCSAALAPAAVVDRDEWRCFHCDEHFTDKEQAALHFGTSLMHNPACQINIAEYRAMETRMERYNEEDADIHRRMYGMQTEHQQALRREEEKGYARGLRDAISTDSDLPSLPSPDMPRGSYAQDYFSAEQMVSYARESVARLNRRAIPEGLLEKAAELLKNYQHVIDGCHSSEIERFDYQPEVQGTADELRALLGKEGE